MADGARTNRKFPRARRASIDAFLGEKKLALAGASRSEKKFGNAILKELLARGYEVVLVHPVADEVAGIPCRRSAADLPADVGGLVLVVPSSEAEGLVRGAAAAGIRRVWMQRGVRSDPALAACAELGIEAVHGECILMFLEPAAWIHRLHRGARRLFGGLPK
ncbi:MAG: CoA-binding protein [Candidatus Latescibacterota bacterium]|nr:MAG: CoA-binding protein [Candidatus Latescibacterota bacterium]